MHMQTHTHRHTNLPSNNTQWQAYAHDLGLYMHAHTYANTNTHTNLGLALERDTSTLQLDTAWDEHIILLTDRENGREESGMKGERQEGWRLAFSSELEEFVLAAKFSLLFFSFPFFSSSPLSFLICIAFFFLPNHHLSNQSGLSLLPLSLSSLHLLFLIILPPLHSTSLLVPWYKM